MDNVSNLTGKGRNVNCDGIFINCQHKSEKQTKFWATQSIPGYSEQLPATVYCDRF